MPLPELFSYLIVAACAAVLAVVLVKLLDRLRRRDAESEAREIIARAERDSANRVKEAELEIKERAIQQKAEGERELAKLRQELHERERLLDKRQDTLDQQAEQLRRQERMVEGNQRKLAEKIEDTNRRNEELASLLDLATANAAQTQRLEPRGSHQAAARTCSKPTCSTSRGR